MFVTLMTESLKVQLENVDEEGPADIPAPPIVTYGMSMLFLRI
jgi:hypothetical protein